MSFYLTFVFILLALSQKVVVSENPLHNVVLRARVVVAECRSTCLRSVGSCGGSPSCSQCWDQCQALGTGADNSCHDENCGEGCQQACDFYRNQNRLPMQYPSKVRSSLEFSTRPYLTGCSLHWGALAPSVNSLRQQRPGPRSITATAAATVHLVLGRDRAGKWYEISQTEAIHTEIAHDTLEKLSELLVVGVDEVGVLASTSIMVKDTGILGCRPILQPTFALQLAKVERAGQLVYAHINWDEPSSASRFIVRWKEVPEGAVSGTIITDSTKVSLPLLPDSRVVVEVQLMDTASVSNQLYISTKLPELELVDPVTIISIVSLILSTFSIVAIFVSIKLRKSSNQPTETNNNLKTKPYASPVHNNLNTVINMPVSPMKNKNFAAAVQVLESPIKLKEMNNLKVKLTNLLDKEMY